MPALENISRFADRHFPKFLVFFAVFYTVGVIGLTLPDFKPLFIQLTPLALLLSSIAMALFHRDHSIKAWLIFASIYVLGLALEIVGVQTGLIFGNYKYGDGLGWKLFGTPLIIGLNWLLLVYASTSVSSRLKITRILQVVIAASILLVYDLILEPVAPKLEMWNWKNEFVPLKNFIAWFVLALLFSALLLFSKINIKNRLAPLILLCQFLFFTLLNFILK